jgi:endonuclease/exonuclease/phosphatase family metal-dependent hydrolase
MIGRLEAFLRRARRAVSRGEWAARWLGLPRAEGASAHPGLVLIQVDGLSFGRLQRALREGRMPFLSRLLGREGYRSHVLCSGVPSSTPAVQAELFYGVRTAIPAFEYFDRAAGKMVRMYDPESAARVERRLERSGAALLEGGVVHGDILNGGAVEGRFCVSAWGWDRWWGKGRVSTPFLVLLAHPLIPLRLAALVVLEGVLAAYDFARGVVAGQKLWKELAFIAARVGNVILLREFSVLGAKVDTARGLPTVHINFFGYDEQAHRRGPDSAFARWSLKGIDDAVRRVWEAAHRSTRRSYDVWVYSDHGQETVVPFAVEKGRGAAEAVADALEGSPVWVGDGERPGALRGRRAGKGEKAEESLDAGHPIVAAMGPLGHVYLPKPPAGEEKRRLARRLVDVAGIPLVMAQWEGQAVAWTPEGEFVFPGGAAEVLGPGHPFLTDAAQDLEALCRHPDAGDFVICGWRRTGPPLSLALENGAHGGPGPQELEAFALLPPDTPLPAGEGPMRPGGLRRAALHFLGRHDAPFPPPSAARAGGRTIRLMTYNVHSCVGMDGKLSPGRIARVIARHAPDVVALQELDVRRRRTGGEHQAEALARRLWMSFHFHPALARAEEEYGDAILSRLPMRLVRAGALPGPPGVEPRGALWAAVEAGGQEVQVIATHLGLLPGERLRQAEALLGPAWLGAAAARGPVVLCGDFNALPGSPVCRRIVERLRDAQLELAGRPPRGTWFGRWPVGRIDHVFIGPGLRVADVVVPATELDKTASDHLPVVVELTLETS